MTHRMKRPWSRTQDLLLGVACCAFALIAYKIVLVETIAQSSAAARLHQDAIVVDGHVHIVNRVRYEGIDPWQAEATGLADYARSKQGGLDVVVEQLYIDDAYNNYNVAVKQAVRMIETFYRVLEANRDKMELALTGQDVRRIVGSGKLAVILALEGGFDPEGDLEVLRLFHRLGVRMIQFVSHNTTNAYADSTFDKPRWNGITDHGRAIVREMNRLGIVIDISHASVPAQQQIIETSAAPVAASHQSSRKFSSWTQNLPDEVLKAMAAKGGVAGMHSSATPLSQQYHDWSLRQPPVAPMPNMSRSADQDSGTYLTRLDSAVKASWLNGQFAFGEPWKTVTRPADAPALPSVADWADQIDYQVNLVGADHVGIGLDLLDGKRSLKDFDASSYPRLTDALVSKGYQPDVVRKILGENWLRLLDSAQVVPATDVSQ